MTTPAGSPTSGSRSSVVSRVAVTAGAAAAVVLVERFVSLPFVRPSALHALGEDAQALSIGALGLAPILAGWLIVEISAVLYDPWSSLRSTPEGRLRLRSRAYALAAVLALAQSAMITVSLARFRIADGPLLTSSGPATLFALTLTLMGGVALYLAIAEVVDRRGLGSGIAVLAGTGLIARFWSQGALHLQGANPPAALVLAGAALVAALWLQSGGAATVLGRHALPGTRTRHPVAGLVPLRIGTAMLLAAATWAAVVQPGGRQELAGTLAPGTSSYAIALGIVSVVLASLLAWLLARPGPVAALWVRAGVGEPSSRVTQAHAGTRRAVLVSAVFVGGLVFVAHAFETTNLTMLYIGELVMVAALLADLWQELGARWKRPELVAVWPLARPYEVAPAIEMLAREGIPAFPRNARWYGLMPVLAAYAPVTLLVPASDAERARTSLRAVFGAPPVA